MHAGKAVFSQRSHFLVRVASSKSLQKVGFSPEGSFELQSRNAIVDFSSGHAWRSVSVSEHAKLSSVTKTIDCRKYAEVGSSCSSTASKGIQFASQESSIFSRNPLGYTAALHAGSSRHNDTSSRHLHCSADAEHNWSLSANEEDFLLRKVSSKGTKKRLPGRQQSHFHSSIDRRSSASEDRIYHLGRLLSGILRHKAVELKLQIRGDGYVVVNDLLKLAIKTRAGIPLSVYTVNDILKAVEQDNKQRFSLLTENGVLLIRASQGHSITTIESDKLLKPILSSDNIPVCVHGTLMSNLDSILKLGLKKMGRNHVHFASGLPKEGGVISGMRHSCEVLIYLDSKKALQDGMKLYLSDNGVILTEGFNGVVPPDYFAKVIRWKNGKLIPLPVRDTV